MVLTTYEPGSIGAVGILAVFFLGYLTVLCSLTLALWVLKRILDRVTLKSSFLRWVSRLGPKEVYYYSSVLAIAPVVLISLKSVGSIGFYEIMLVVLFEILGCVYVAKRAT